MKEYKDYTDLYTSKKFEDSLLLLKSLVDDGINLMKLTHKILNDNEITRSQHLLFQMVLRRSASIHQLFEHNSFGGQPLTDFLAVASIGRANYETSLLAASFGLKKEKSELEMLRFLLWRIAANKNRIQVSDIPENVEENLRSSIANDQSKIESLDLYHENIKPIKTCIQRKEYHIAFKNNLLETKSWKMYESTHLTGAMLFYTNYSHPSGIAVDNFSEAYSNYNPEKQIPLLKTSIVFLCYASFVIMSAANSFPKNEFGVFCVDVTDFGKCFSF